MFLQRGMHVWSWSVGLLGGGLISQMSHPPPKGKGVERRRRRPRAPIRRWFLPHAYATHATRQKSAPKV